MEYKVKKFYDKDNCIEKFAKSHGCEIFEQRFITDYKGYMCLAKAEEKEEKTLTNSLLAKLRKVAKGFENAYGYHTAYDLNDRIIFVNNSEFAIIDESKKSVERLDEQWIDFLYAKFGDEYLDELDFEKAHESELEKRDKDYFDFQNEIQDETTEAILERIITLK